MNTPRAEKVARFRQLHGDGCFVIPNPWDAGSARILEGLGFVALATTSSGYAFTLGLADGDVDRDTMLAHAAAVSAATNVPVSADMEDGHAGDAAGVAETVRLAAEAGLSGMSVEDRARGPGKRFYSFAEAVERVGAAAEAARRHDIVLTARADGMLGGGYGLDEAIARLQAFEKAGADVVYAPGVPDLAGLTRLCAAVSAPVNHLAWAGNPLTFAEIAEAGVRRISVGGGLARAVGGAMLGLGRALHDGDLAAIYDAPSWTTLRGGA